MNTNCNSCGADIYSGTICYECYGNYDELANEKGKANHNSRLRCPKCKETCEVRDYEDGELYFEGVHLVICSECDHEFEFVTGVSYVFTSPAIRLSND